MQTKKKITLPTFSEQTESKALTQFLLNDLENFKSRTDLFAKMHKISYESHLKEGFTEKQSLELCKTLT